jgi:hypothetical protein
MLSAFACLYCAAVGLKRVVWDGKEKKDEVGNGEGEKYLVIGKCKQFLPEHISVLGAPFVGQECLNFVTPAKEGGPVAPDRVGCIAQFDAGGISGDVLDGMWRMGRIRGFRS